jgi:hypothetical protein
MKIHARISGIALVLQLLSVSALAQESDSSEFLEEIVVTGELTPSRLRFQMERAQDDIYRLFNQLLDDKDYKVNCKKEASTGSYILRRGCEPVFISNERARNAAHTMSAWRSGEDPQLSMELALSSGRVSESELRFDMEHKYEEMNQQMFDLAISNPELMAAMQRFAELKSAYEVLDSQTRQPVKKKGLLCGLLSRSCADEVSPSP